MNSFDPIWVVLLVIIIILIGAVLWITLSNLSTSVLAFFKRFVDGFQRQVVDRIHASIAAWRARGAGRSYSILPSVRPVTRYYILLGESHTCASKLLSAILFLVYVPYVAWIIVKHKAVTAFLGDAPNGSGVAFWLLLSLFGFIVLLHMYRVYFFVERLENPFSSVHWAYVRKATSSFMLNGEYWTRLVLLIILVVFGSLAQRENIKLDFASTVAQSLSNSPAALDALRGKSQPAELLNVFFTSLLFVYATCLLWDVIVCFGTKTNVIVHPFFILNLVNSLFSALAVIVLHFVTSAWRVDVVALSMAVISISTCHSLLQLKRQSVVSHPIKDEPFWREIVVNVLFPYVGRECTVESTAVSCPLTTGGNNVLCCRGPEISRELAKK